MKHNYNEIYTPIVLLLFASLQISKELFRHIPNIIREIKRFLLDYCIVIIYAVCDT